ncbi:ATP-binding protein [Nonomuraea sp. B19D2]|uniref:ATP-binding protein n=1 Tax=Nonomuraea sp. B19D2 TaxID=3159561 RepID=UPI0032DADC88
MFQQFTRLEASPARDPGGTGLGLPIAQKISHAHGGTLSAQDRGAWFVLRLPARATSDHRLKSEDRTVRHDRNHDRGDLTPVHRVVPAQAERAPGEAGPGSKAANNWVNPR